MSTTLSIVLSVVILANILAYLWLLLGTSNTSNNEHEDEHVWDEDIRELNNPMPRWWKAMFLLSIVFSIGYLVLYPGLGNWQGTLGWSSQQTLEQDLAKLSESRNQQLNTLAALPIADLATHPEALAQGKALFAQHCAGCHGRDAQGSLGFPNLSDQDWLYGGDPETIYASITHGRSGGMPAFASMLSQAEIDTVSAYIKQWPAEPSPGPEQQGRDIFAQRCSFCHGKNGEGNPTFGAPNLKDDIWLYGSSRFEIVQTVSKGRSGNMPAHEALMSEEERRIVSAWVYSLSQEP